MRKRLYFIAVVICVTQIFPVGVLAHGRNSSVVRADINETTGIIQIHAVLADLLEMGGIHLSSWEGFSGPQREKILNEQAAVLINSFQLIQDRHEFLRPQSINLEDASLSQPGRNRMNIVQQAIQIELGYAFASPPEDLTFWLLPGDNNHHGGHYQLMIRRRGELVMLPAEIGEGKLIRFPFNWETDPEPIAERDSLAGVVCGPQNRSASAVLNKKNDEVRLRVFVPLPGNLDRPEQVDRFIQQVRAGVSIKIDETLHIPFDSEWQVQSPGINPESRPEAGDLLMLIFFRKLSKPVCDLSISFSLPDLANPLLYLHITEPDQPEKRLALETDASTYAWQGSP